MCSIDVRLKIEAAAFYLWRALEFHAYLVSDARKRGAVINRRSGTLTCANLVMFLYHSAWKSGEALAL